MLIVSSALAEVREYDDDVEYQGPFVGDACVRLIHEQPLVVEARCYTGVKRNYLNYLVMMLSTELSTGRLSSQDICTLLRSLWSGINPNEAVPAECRVEFLPSPLTSELMVIESVGVTEEVLLELAPVVASDGSVYYPFSSVVWVEQHRVKLQ